MIRGSRSTNAAVALVAVIAAACVPGVASASKLATKAEVVSVVDGDTINVDISGRTEPVRFIGIDTPEVYPVKDCGGDQSTKSMNDMLDTGDQVRLVRDPSQGNRDTYDRLLRYVELNGKDLGRKQVGKGWAEVFVFDRPFARLGSYRDKERRARRTDRGVWGLCPGNFPD